MRAAEPLQALIAVSLQKGLKRFYAGLGQATLSEFKLPSGRRADLMALSRQGLLTIVEIKSGPADFRADSKWPEYHDYCDLFYFAIPQTMRPDIIPQEIGLIIADAYDAIVLREAVPHPLNAARRKAVTLRFARTAAFRLEAGF